MGSGVKGFDKVTLDKHKKPIGGTSTSKPSLNLIDPTPGTLTRSNIAASLVKNS